VHKYIVTEDRQTIAKNVAIGKIAVGNIYAAY